MAFKPGDEAWMVVPGDAKAGAGLHEVQISDVQGDEVLITRDAWTDTELKFPQCPEGWFFKALTPDDKVLLPANETFSGHIKQLADEGEGYAVVYRKDDKFEGGVEDLVSMNQLNDAELARNLRAKFKDHVGWVRCGPTLVAMNLKAGYQIDWEFGDGDVIKAYPTHDSLLEKFKNLKSRNDAPPHAWALASEAYQNLFRPLNAVHTKFDQSLIITGESGAGKTWNTKQILKFLSYVGQSDLTEKMLATTPILEGFGNANMPRNPDSSRFGKLYQVFFSKSTQALTACSINPYMLEKSRVSAQQRSERNFHMFYRMLCPPRDIMDIDDVKGKSTLEKRVEEANDILDKEKRFTVAKGAVCKEGEVTYWEEGGKKMLGLPQSKKDMCKLGKFEDYVYLRGGTKMDQQDFLRIYEDLPADWGPDGGAGSVPNQDPRIYDDAMHMSHTLAALYGFFTEDEVDQILKTTAGVLHLGNVEILGQDDDDECEGVNMSGASGTALETAAELWKVDAGALATACCKQTIWMGGAEDNTKQIAAKGGRDGGIILRDTVARFVYDKLFMFIVAKCSNLLAENKGRDDVFLGVLDIFGFEFYENAQLQPMDGAVVNGLDQLNINICNEMLQQQFVTVIFGLEQVTYDDQQIVFNFSEYENNKPAVDFLTAPRGSPLLEGLAAPAKRKKSGKEADNVFMENLEKMAAQEEKKVGTKVYLDFKSLKGRKPFDGTPKGGPYGNSKEHGNHVDDVNKSMDPKGMKGRCPAFGIRHYAADVAYDCRGWLEKDKSSPAVEMTDCFSVSQDTFFMAPTFAAEAKPGSGGVTHQFVASLKDLLQTLGRTDMSFVRCLKASNPLAKEVFQSALVLKQLKYTGMLDTLKIRRFGYPKRYGYQDFVDKYAIIAKKENIALKLEEGDANAKAVIAGENSQIIADLFQKTYAHQVFEELPDSDKKDKTIIEQRKEVIAVGKPRDPQATTPMVMLRDWFDRGMEERVGVLLKEVADIAQAQAAAAVNQKLLYGKKAESCKEISSWFRSLSGRSGYLADKWCYLAGHARTELAFALRAQIQRAEYARERAKKFEGVNRQTACSWIQATVVRQHYYVKKMEYLDVQMRKTVEEKMRQQQEYANQYVQDALLEAQEAREECGLMLKEEKYIDALENAAFLDNLEKKKLSQLDKAREAYDQAKRRYDGFTDTLGEIAEMDNLFETDKGRLMLETMKQALIEHQKSWYTAQAVKFGWPPYKRFDNQQEIDRFHVKYREAPVNSDLRSWREYLYGAVACEQMEQVDAFQCKMDEHQRQREKAAGAQAVSPMSTADHEENMSAQLRQAKLEAEISLEEARLSGHQSEIDAAKDKLARIEDRSQRLLGPGADMPASNEEPMSPASRRYLQVNLDCNQNPDEFEPSVQAALKRCISSLLSVNTKAIRFG